MKHNRVTLIGYVGQHLASRTLDNGRKRVGIRLATHHSVKHDNSEKTTRTTWHNIVAWNSNAEFAERSFVKGSHIMVEGCIEYRSFIGREGKKINLARILAFSMTNLDR